MRGPLRALRTVFGLRARSFRRALHDPRAAQDAVLDRIVADLAGTAFGREHRIRSVGDFRDRVVPRTWDELRPWLDRQHAGERDVLTRQPVLFHEPTSGSSGPVKRVPYTTTLRSVFSRMFVVWAHDLLANGPAFRTGKAYFSVSPAVGDDGGRHLKDDGEYLDGWVRTLVSPFVVLPDITGVREPDRFWDRVATALVGAPGLETISVWNPSFLTILLERVAGRREVLAASLSPDRRRALFADPVDWRRLWPELKLVSCWADGHAAPAADALATQLPGVLVQPKGLLATEAPVTVPLVGHPGGAPLVDGVVVELLDGDRLVPLHAARAGVYEVVLTTPGGLLRYRLGDRVAVVGRVHGTPLLQFVGRTGGVVDLVGEKLHPAFVAETLAAVVDQPFRTLVPLRRPSDHYALVVAQPVPADTADRLDRALQRGHHYRKARLLGQLGAPEVVVSADAPAAFVAAMAGAARLGDVKHRFLVPVPGDDWVAPLRG